LAKFTLTKYFDFALDGVFCKIFCMKFHDLVIQLQHIIRLTVCGWQHDYNMRKKNPSVTIVTLTISVQCSQIRLLVDLTLP